MKRSHQHIGRLFSPLLIQKLNKTGVQVSLPGQNTAISSDSPAIHVTDWSFFVDVLMGYDLGFAESYLKGKWHSADLTSLFTMLNQDTGKEASFKVGNLSPVKMWGRFIQTIRSSNSLYWASRNIKSHYDFSNEFFSSFLDSTMTYSAGIFESTSDTLQDAQVRKLDRMLSRGAIKQSDHILDIGCGWGSLLTRAASSFGCSATGVTLSENQFSHCKDLVHDLGLSKKIAVQLIDYRKMTGLFDHIFAVEMLEAVGHKGLQEFFSHCNRLLKPDGTIQLQVIIVPDHRYDSYRKNCDFIQKYIFPGGLLLSKDVIYKTADKYGFSVKETHSIGSHYVHTLQRWAANLESVWSHLREQGFSERNLRRFEYYFNYCESAFASGYIDDIQLSLEKRKN